MIHNRFSPRHFFFHSRYHAVFHSTQANFPSCQKAKPGDDEGDPEKEQGSATGDQYPTTDPGVEQVPVRAGRGGMPLVGEGGQDRFVNHFNVCHSPATGHAV